MQRILRYDYARGDFFGEGFIFSFAVDDWGDDFGFEAEAGVDQVVDGVVRAEVVHGDWLGLADAVGAVFGLHHDARGPV